MIWTKATEGIYELNDGQMQGLPVSIPLLFRNDSTGKYAVGRFAFKGTGITIMWEHYPKIPFPFRNCSWTFIEN